MRSPGKLLQESTVQPFNQKLLSDLQLRLHPGCPGHLMDPWTLKRSTQVHFHKETRRSQALKSLIAESDDSHS